MLVKEVAGAKFRQACGFAESLVAIALDSPSNMLRQRSSLIGAMLHIEQAAIFLGEIYADTPAQSALLAARNLDLHDLAQLGAQASSQSSALLYRELASGDLASFWPIKERYRTSADLSLFEPETEADGKKAPPSVLIATDLSAKPASDGGSRHVLAAVTAKQCRKWIAALLKIEELLISLDVEC